MQILTKKKEVLTFFRTGEYARGVVMFFVDKHCLGLANRKKLDSRANRPRFAGSETAKSWKTAERDKLIMSKDAPTNKVLAEQFGCDPREISARRTVLRKEAEAARLRRIEVARKRLLARTAQAGAEV